MIGRMQLAEDDRGPQLRIGAHEPVVHPEPTQRRPHVGAEAVVSDAGDHRGRAAEARRRDGDVRRAAAERLREACGPPRAARRSARDTGPRSPDPSSARRTPAPSPGASIPRAAAPARAPSRASSSPPAIMPTRSSSRRSGAGVVALHFAPAEDHEAVADRMGVVRVVGDEDHAHASLARLGDVAKHHAGLLHPERRGRLVEDEHPGAEMDRPRDGDGLALPARERADRLRRIAQRDAEMPQLLLRPPARSGRRRADASVPAPTQGSAPRKKFRQMLRSGIIARS